ncbi:MAG: transcriptional repressor LexA [Spirochaetales bacterium]|uniref:LexA repressor n=1 Tax=Candidatus Thalassospirochaeta sargassi TaxID=3119039 RepID=A0AAJ1IB86_9SPIO|nr:transcriptional repressor LexA [Spirochaetales bacterium]
MKELTKRQEETLDYIRSYIEQHKYPPTIREMAASFSISVKGAYDHIKALEKKGRIKCDGNRSRTIEILDQKTPAEPETLEVPILGKVAAGKPLFAEENFEGTINMPVARLGKGTFFALHVAGDSMQDIGILDGDTAIFKQRNTADNGDIVVAMINEEAYTLKRFYREKNRIKLKAENPVYPPIYTQNVKVLGKLKCIVRDYD